MRKLEEYSGFKKIAFRVLNFYKLTIQTMEKSKEKRIITPAGWGVIILALLALSFGTVNTILLKQSNTYANGVVAEILGGKGVVIEYFHPQKKRICRCNESRVHSLTSKKGNPVIIKLHPFLTWVCDIDWAKTEKYIVEHPL